MRANRRVLFLAPQPYFTLRGMCLAQQACLEALARLGWGCDVLTFPGGDDLAPPGTRLLRLPAVPGAGHVPIGPSWRKALYDVLLLAALAARLARERYPLVHACEESVFLAAALKPLFGFRLVYDMDDVLSRRLRRSGFIRSRRLIRLARRLERWALERCDAVVTNARGTTRYARRFAAPGKVFFYHHAPPAPAASGSVCAEEPCLLYAGNLEEYQGVGLLLESLPQVLSRRRDARITIVGGETAQIERLRSRAAALGVGEHVDWLGRRPLQETYALMRRARVLVAPMTEPKATPMKLYAYLAAGAPIVATDVPGNAELLEAEAAELVQPRPSALAAGILRALERPRARPAARRRTGLGPAAVERALAAAYSRALS